MLGLKSLIDWAAGQVANQYLHHFYHKRELLCYILRFSLLSNSSFLVTQSFKVRPLRHLSLSKLQTIRFAHNLGLLFSSRSCIISYLFTSAQEFLIFTKTPIGSALRFHFRPSLRNSLISEYILLSQWLRWSYSRQSCACCTRGVAVRAPVARLRTATRSSGDSPDPIVVYIYILFLQ